MTIGFLPRFTFRNPWLDMRILDEYGFWSETPDYGWAWTPRVAAGWVPYHYGRWAWVEPWGWTWIDEAPWGLRRFIMGAGLFTQQLGPGYRVRWTARPVYAPALVVFVGGPRFTMSLNAGPGGTVAWFPLGLASRSFRLPGFQRLRRSVNITHATISISVNVTNIRYANQQAPAPLRLCRQGFVNARPVREFGPQASACRPDLAS